MEKVAENDAPANQHKMTSKSLVFELAKLAGITINGNEPWDIQVHNEKFYDRVIQEASLGLGESYMDKWWDCPRLDIFFEKILRVNLEEKVNIPLQFKVHQMLAKIFNFQSRARAKIVAETHYDLGNELFIAMLDKRMIYSCAYWKEAKNLDQAQEAKLDLICRKLQLKPGLRLLDIGCGWGGLARFAAENYGVSVTGVTISKQQADFAQQYCKGLPIEIRLQDYRDINEVYDRVVSVGMFEHVGHLNYTTFMEVAHKALHDDGLFLLHTIGGNRTSPFGNEWIAKYIFPNGMIPTIPQISKAAENFFVTEDWHNFGADYDTTLMAWHENFIQHWHSLKAKYDERFYRMWTYYLLCCAGSFRARSNQLWQVVFSKKGLMGGYRSPR